MTTGKTIALTRRTFVGEVISINNLRYAADTTLMADSKEKLKNLLMKVKKLA